MKFTRHPEISSHQVNQVWMILEPNKKFVRKLNSTAGLIWELAAKPTSIQAVTKMMVKKFDQPELVIAIEADVTKLVKNYLKLGFLVEID